MRTILGAKCISFPGFPLKITSPTINLRNKTSKPEDREGKKNTIRITAMAKEKKKQYWLLKTEPGEWSWEDQAANEGLTKWDGVKNKQAQKYLKSMTLNDLCFFYHSGAKARRVVGVVKVAREWYSEGEKGEGAVDVKAIGEMRRGVDLKEMKGEEGLKGFALFRQPRLSVVPVEEEVWRKVCDLGGGFEGDGVECVDGEDD